MKIIEVKGLSKKYKNNSFFSLKDANFTIYKGDIVGLIGKNGAGKSTLLKLMSKAQKPTNGTVVFKGQDIYKKENILNSFGIMIEPVFYEYLTVEENLKVFLKIHRGEHHYSKIEEILKLVDLWNSRNRKPETFSFGMKQRTALALALITEPEFIMLDEPFVGLDPFGVKNLIDILKRWSDNKQTSMIISSHQLSELESICNRYIFIENGKLKEKDSNKGRSLLIYLNPQNNNESLFLNGFAAEYGITIENNVLEIPVDMENKKFNIIIEKLADRKLIKNISHSKDHLEDLFEERGNQ